MLRFTIRELLVVTALVGVCVAWRTDSVARAHAHQTTREHAESLRESFAIAKDDYETLIEFVETGKRRIGCGNTPRPDWDLAQKPIP